MSYSEAMELVRELRARGCDPRQVNIGRGFVVRCKAGGCLHCPARDLAALCNTQ